jgi:hypothetical protein
MADSTDLNNSFGSLDVASRGSKFIGSKSVKASNNIMTID